MQPSRYPSSDCPGKLPSIARRTRDEIVFIANSMIRFYELDSSQPLDQTGRPTPIHLDTGVPFLALAPYVATANSTSTVPSEPKSASALSPTPTASRPVQVPVVIISPASRPRPIRDCWFASQMSTFIGSPRARAPVPCPLQCTIHCHRYGVTQEVPTPPIGPPGTQHQDNVDPAIRRCQQSPLAAQATHEARADDLDGAGDSAYRVGDFLAHIDLCTLCGKAFDRRKANSPSTDGACRRRRPRRSPGIRGQSERAAVPSPVHSSQAAAAPRRWSSQP